MIKSEIDKREAEYQEAEKDREEKENCMNRLFPRIAIGLLAFTVGVYAHSECNRLAEPFAANGEAVSAIPPQLVDPVTEQSCDKITTAWHAGTLTRNIPSAVQIRCWGIDEGKAHPLAQIMAHSPDH